VSTASKRNAATEPLKKDYDLFVFLIARLAPEVLKNIATIRSLQKASLRTYTLVSGS